MESFTAFTVHEHDVSKVPSVTLKRVLFTTTMLRTLWIPVASTFAAVRSAHVATSMNVETVLSVLATQFQRDCYVHLGARGSLLEHYASRYFALKARDRYPGHFIEGHPLPLSFVNFSGSHSLRLRVTSSQISPRTLVELV